ncbi:MAG TPA: hypothetical protein PLN69_06135 [bacterium]|nr:hypothetical protein [bacterium]
MRKDKSLAEVSPSSLSYLRRSLLKNSRCVILRKCSDRRISITSPKSEILRYAQDDKLSTVTFFNSLAGRYPLLNVDNIL